MLPNWFIAFPVDPAVIASLPKVPPAFRAFHSDDVHLTITFLGACGETAAHHAFDTLAAALSERPEHPLHISLAGVVPMGPRGRYSALSALVRDGNDDAVEFLRRWRDVAADAAGINRDQRTPIPHVTVARPQRRATDEQRAGGLEWAQTVTLPAHRLTLDRIGLYTWSERRLPRLFQIVKAVVLPNRA